jgi:predicted helicase
MQAQATTSSKRSDSAQASYENLHSQIAQPSNGLDAETMAAYYLTHTGQFKWALKWDDLKLHGPYRWTATECGIDVVAEHLDGTLWAIQVKDYGKRVGLRAYNDMQAFAQEGAKHGVDFGRLAIFCANSGPTDRLRQRCATNNVVLYTRVDFNEIEWLSTLEQLSLDYELSLDRSEPLKNEGPRWPRAWVAEGLPLVRAELKKTGKATIVAVPGSGKTDFILSLVDDYDTVAIVVPSKALARQIYGEVIKYADEPWDHILFVCSDLGDLDDIRASDLPARNTTDPAEIAAFMALPGRKLVIALYHSSRLLVPHTFDFAAFDEAHHMAEFRTRGGKAKRAEALLTGKNIARKAFFTGTERTYSTEIKRYAGQGSHYIASMDDTEKFGRKVVDFTYEAALRTTENTDEKIVKRYVVHWVHVNDPRLEQTIDDAKNVINTETYRRERTAHMLAIAGANYVRSEHAYLTHGVVFCNSIDNADCLRNLARARNAEWCETISSREGVERSLALLDQYKAEVTAMFTNVNSMGEGINAVCIDHVILADPMQSPSSIGQKILRGIRWDATKTAAENVLHIVVPCDIEDGQPTVKSYEMIASILGALGEVDYTLRHEIDEIASNEIGSGRELRFKVDADVPSLDPEKLAQTVCTMVYSSADLVWWKNYEAVKAHRETHGGKDDPQKGSWINTQKLARRGSSSQALLPLTPEKVAALEALPGGFDWGQKRQGSVAKPMTQGDEQAILDGVEAKKTASEIAQEIGSTVGTVRSRVFALRKAGALPSGALQPSLTQRLEPSVRQIRGRRNPSGDVGSGRLVSAPAPTGMGFRVEQRVCAHWGSGVTHPQLSWHARPCQAVRVPGDYGKCRPGRFRAERRKRGRLPHST